MVLVNCHVSEDIGGLGLGCLDSCIIAEGNFSYENGNSPMKLFRNGICMYRYGNCH